MKTTVSLSDFRDAFQIRKYSFTYEGLEALFNYLESYEDDTGEEIELDVIALCGDYTEYADLAEFQQDYGEDYESLDDIEEKTTVIRIDGEAFIIQSF